MLDTSASSYPPPELPSNYSYTPYYCEENIYLLADSFYHDHNITNAWEINVVFVSNASNTVALWSQKQSRDPDRPVVWDYHCILVLRPRLEPVTEPAWVYDYDSFLAIPCSWLDYVRTTFKTDMHEMVPEQYRSNFRVIPVADFLDNFASDRSHMLKTLVVEGEPEYIAPPPNYPCIVGPRNRVQGVSNNLMQKFVKMSRPENEFELEDGFIGRVMSYVEFWEWGLCNGAQHGASECSSRSFL